MPGMARLLLLALALFLAPAALAQQNAFDLAGPDLAVTVTRDGVALPVTAVPALRTGDRLTARAVLPPDQAARYRLVVAFLRGATNPPPKKWFFAVETWSRKRNVLDVTVPEGAEQAILFLAPETGGGFDAVRGAVRGRPGVFVRAAQDLYQASLDRARLDAFVAAIGRIGDTAPERLVTAAPILANALRIKLNAECLTRQRGLQAACLTQSRDALVLQAQRGTTLAETLTGTPVDLAYRVAATPEGGAGYYSPYIGLARDVARLFGAFRTAQYQYLPALSLEQGDRIRLQLNAAPSFQNPRSVLVAPLPPIGVAPPPVWRSAAPAPVCLTQPDMVLPLDDASLLFATGHARDLVLKVTTTDGRGAELPLVANAERGGLRLANGSDLSGIGSVTDAVLQGKWGFDPFSGPHLPVRHDTAGAWRARPDDAVVVGRDHPLRLTGGASACIERLSLRDGEERNRPLQWKTVAPEEVEATLPLTGVRPGSLRLTIARYGTATPDTLPLIGRAEPSRLDRFTIHAGDRAGTLTGARLDQVAGLVLNEQRFTAGALTRGADGDRLELTAPQPVAVTGSSGPAAVTLRDGRAASVPATIGEARPSARLLSRVVTATPPAGTLSIDLPEGLVPAGGTLTFSFAVTGTLADRDTIEIATVDGGATTLTFASGALQRSGNDVVVARIAPRQSLGATATGPLRFRLRHGDAVGDWQPLAHVVRLPVLNALECPAQGAECRLVGNDLFLIAAAGDARDPARSVTVPPGFVGPSITLPRPSQGKAFVRLHDAPDVMLPVTPTG